MQVVEHHKGEHLGLSPTNRQSSRAFQLYTLTHDGQVCTEEWKWLGQAFTISAICISCNHSRFNSRITILPPVWKRPTTSVLNHVKSLYVVNVDDYKTAITIALSEAWKTAQENIKSAQKKQKKKKTKEKL